MIKNYLLDHQIITGHLNWLLECQNFLQRYHHASVFHIIIFNDPTNFITFIIFKFVS